MTRLLIAGALALALAGARPATAGAQERDSVTARDLRDQARAAARRAVAIYNAPNTLRASGDLTIDSSRTIGGDVAVTAGTLVVAGHVTGRVAAINADLVLRPGARVDGEIIVVGGELTGRADATLGASVTHVRAPAPVREDGDVLVVEDEPLVDRWLERWRTRHARSTSGFRLSSGGTYNRVEGLPVHFGAVLRRRLPWGRATAEALGIYRSARDFRWDSRNIGHDVRGELAYGHDRGVALGGRLYDVVSPVSDDLEVGDTENGLASFVLHRDFRDHFDRHGGTVYLRGYAGEQLELTVALADQRWGNREDRDPWSLFRDNDTWRANPALDEGQFHVASARLRVDTRNDVDHPWAGWYLLADVERGSGAMTRGGATTDAHDRPSVPGETEWVRGWLDVRRYSRLAPNAQLNVRAVLGGWLGGDALPLNRRVALGGPGTLPGYDFRRDALTTLTCAAESGSVVPGTPAQCERIALVQVEYRSDIRFELDLFGASSGASRLRVRRGQWLLFANSGRGWLVGPRVDEQQYRSGDVPTMSTFRTDIGAGLDFGRIGAYVAKSVTDGDEPPNFFVRLRRRF